LSKYLHTLVLGGMEMYHFKVLEILRYAVAYVFIISGIMKLLNETIATHFMNLGLPYPQQTMYIVALLEVGCGILIIIKKWVKYASMPLIFIMIGAILITKVPLLHTGLLNFFFQARLDIVMLALLLIIYHKHS
jgi:putative oxidoreductase